MTQPKKKKKSGLIQTESNIINNGLFFRRKP